MSKVACPPVFPEAKTLGTPWADRQPDLEAPLKDASTVRAYVR